MSPPTVGAARHRAPLRQPILHTVPREPEPARRDPSEVAHRGGAGVTSISGGAAAPVDPRAVVEGLVAANLRDGVSVHAELPTSGPELAALARLSPEELRGMIADATRRQAGDGVAGQVWRASTGRGEGALFGRIQDHLRLVVAGEMHAEMREVAGRYREGVRALREDLPGQLDALRSAEPGTPEAHLASLLGIRGGDAPRAEDLARAMARADALVTGAERFHAGVDSPSLAPADYPAAAARAAARLGAGEIASGSMLEHAIHGEGPTAGLSRAASHAHHAGELLHNAYEVAAHGPRALAGFSGLAALGGAVVLGLHMMAARQHEANVALGRALGL